MARNFLMILTKTRLKQHFHGVHFTAGVWCTHIPGENDRIRRIETKIGSSRGGWSGDDLEEVDPGMIYFYVNDDSVNISWCHQIIQLQCQSLINSYHLFWFLRFLFNLVNDFFINTQRNHRFYNFNDPAPFIRGQWAGARRNPGERSLETTKSQKITTGYITRTLTRSY